MELHCQSLAPIIASEGTSSSSSQRNEPRHSAGAKCHCDPLTLAPLFAGCVGGCCSRWRRQGSSGKVGRRRCHELMIREYGAMLRL